MLETLTDMLMKSVLVLGIGFALIIRLATKHPNASDGIVRGILSMLFRK
jgi:hypothetical protein